MNLLDSIEKKITQISNIVVTFLFFLILAVTILMVILRYVFNSGVYGGNELISYLFVYTTAIGAAITIGSNEHISISIITDLLPAKIHKAFDILSAVLVGLFNLLLIFLSVPWMQRVGSFESPTLRIPNALVHFAVPSGCALAFIYSIFRIRHIIKEDKNAPSAV